ncbi:glutamic acid-rich protein [Diachasma alloeum]|uniref:glutamic acid-rich protein n=1 Tax=Diachasma alloeum TaxID=454923 RepID=UPI00073826DA|nr:glutamic acid-rich protein [Diachasma alloeum]
MLRGGLKQSKISHKINMKKNKDVSDDEDEYSADDPEEVEGASEEDWTPELGVEGGTKKRSQRGAKKRQHSEEEEEEEEEEDEEEDEEDEEEDDESDEEDSAKKPKKKRRSKKEEDDEDDSDDNNFDDTSGIPAKSYTSGAFVVAKADVGGDTDPTLWRIDGKALLQKYVPFKEQGKTLYRGTSTYSGWCANHKDRYLAAHVSFKVQNRSETVVELHLIEEQPETVKVDKEG